MAATVAVPAVNVLQIRKATVWPHGVVLAREDLVVVEPGADPASDFVAGQWDTVKGSLWRPDEALVWTRATRRISLPRATLLTTRVPENHFHFMIENLSRIAALRAADIQPSLLIASRHVNTAGRAALAACAPGWPVVWVDDDTVVDVDELLVPSFPTNHPDTTRIPWIEGSGYSAFHMQFLRDQLLPLADLVADTPECVYLERRGTTARSLLNARQIRRIAVEHGFVPVDPGQLTMADQVALFSRARVIVGAGGAAFANLVFCSPGAQVVGLVSDQLSDFCMQANLATFAGADFMYVTGPSPGSRFAVAHHREWFHQPFRVSPRKFKAALRKVLADARA